ncbi:MAG TPA: polymer-forming cytoskeletal protein [Candidatus Acidoferrales bacterium]|nr:polymer-forming cytoskeletal protein [Candidatus Acidoferrales bacterium]
MALWKEATSKEPQARDTRASEAIGKDGAPPEADGGVPAFGLARRSSAHESGGESLIAAHLTIEGKIEGAGHVRIAGCFKGDVHVDGNLTIERGARVTGEVRAQTVTVAGELEGNIHAAARVELQESGVLVGDLKAGSLTVAAGSRMRGRAEFGWDERTLAQLDGKKSDGSQR